MPPSECPPRTSTAESRWSGGSAPRISWTGFVWPFEGERNRLLRDVPLIVAEMYPRIAYAIAVALELPARAEAPRKKTAGSVSEDWVSRLRTAPWIRRFDVAIADEASALSNE